MERFRADTVTAALLSVRPSYSFHVVERCDDGHVTALRDVASADLRINGGGYLFRGGILDMLDSGEDLVDAPFAALAAEGRLAAYPLRRVLGVARHAQGPRGPAAARGAGAAPWAVWRRGAANA